MKTTDLKHLTLMSEDALLVDRIEIHQGKKKSKDEPKRISVQVSFREEFSLTQNAIRFANFSQRKGEPEETFLARINAAVNVAQNMLDNGKMVPSRLFKTDNGRQFYVIKGFDRTEADGYFSTYGTNRTDYWEEYLIDANKWNNHETYAWAVSEGRYIRHKDRVQEVPAETTATEAAPAVTDEEITIDFTNTEDQLDAVIAEADSTSSPE